MPLSITLFVPWIKNWFKLINKILTVYPILIENAPFLISHTAEVIYEGCVTISSFRSWRTGLKRAPQRGYVTPHQNPAVSLSYTDTQRSPTLSTPSQSVTDSLLITSHPTPEPATVWYRWNLAELTFTQQTDRFKSQTVIFTHTTLQTTPPDDPKPISVTTSFKHSQQSGLLPLKSTEFESGLHRVRIERSGLISFWLNGTVLSHNESIFCFHRVTSDFICPRRAGFLKKHWREKDHIRLELWFQC